VILRTTFRGNSLVSASVIPCRISYLRPEVIEDKTDRQQLFDYLTSISSNVAVDRAGQIVLSQP
ncbi:MAG: hypothetical protein ABIK86_06465, partial [candidate division WOR-3 bacterium]